MYKKSKLMRALAFTMAAALSLTGLPMTNALAAPEGANIKKPAGPAYETVYEDEGYSLVWHDEFDGTSLNLEDWNVESHEPGWANSELQRYVSEADMEDNIKVSENNLVITPTAEKKPVVSANDTGVNILKGEGFDNKWAAYADAAATGSSCTLADGKVTVTVANPGTQGWHIHAKQENLTLTKDHKYSFKMKAVTTGNVNVKVGVQDPNQDYKWYGGADKALVAGQDNEVAFEFTVDGALTTSETIQVQIEFGGALNETKTTPVVVTLSDVSFEDITNVGKAATGKSVLAGDGFDSKWAAYADAAATGSSCTLADGKVTVTVANPGTQGWHIHAKQENITLTKDHKYSFKMKATTTGDVNVKVGVQDPNQDYKWYGGAEKALVAGQDNEVAFEFEVNGDLITSETVQVQIEFGGALNETKTTPAVVTLSDVSFVDLSVEDTSEVDVKKAYSYTSGRINTQNKHDFTYGRFEASVKVPRGQGYLPAFWLMATDEGNYGQWPQCGEIDIMEVKGQNTKKSYHTIHYGYDARSGHKENQGTKEFSDEGDFCDEYHTFMLDWEPGKMTWYVDGEEVYTTNDWYTGKDAESHLAYPAPFDQEFYVILNLAVGGEWVTYPTQEVVDNMIAGQEDQSYYVDYVRVYQKDKAVYEAQEEEAEAPVHEVVYRQPDAQGNYVVNGDFSKELKAADAEGDNFELHLEDDGAGSTWKVENNQVKITPAAAGSQNHSVQLKQTGIPMYKDCEYEISYDAYADEARTIVVDIEGPDRGWTRYFKDTTQELTTTKKTYTHTFTMEEKTDPNGSLEFNLGNQGSTAAVYISNVKVIVKSGEAVVKPEEKTVRADGNYIYNGGFDQGNKRLGYWEFDEKDAENIRVIKDGGKQLKVTVQDSPITLRQADLPRIIAGEYEIGFDAYMEEGSDADAMTVIVSDRKFEPQLSKTSQHFAKDLLMRENVESKDAWVEITFSKPGTYYLDNVMLCEALLLKNGSFKAGLAGYTPYIYNNNLASYVVDNINNPSTFVMTVNDTGADDAANDWYIQLNQDGIKLEKGKTYKVSFKAKSSIERQIKYSLQQFEGNWTNYSGTDTPIDLTTAWQTISKEFTMTNETDNATRFNITMGSIGGTRITEKHEVYIDDIELVEVGEAKTPEQETADQEAAGQVNQLIAAIGTVTLNDESKAKIDAADDAYEALTLDQQKVITDEEYAVLADAKKTYAALKKAAEDKAAADAVKALINAIGTVAFTDESKAKIDAASQAYEKLTDDQKALLKDEYKVLTAANETYAELKKKAETPITIPIEENKDGKKDESKEDPKPSTPVVTGSTKDADGSLSDHDGVAEVGETQVTKQGTITVTGKDTAEFAPSAAELKKKTSTVPATGIVDGQTVKVTALASKAYAKANNLKKLVLGKNITTLPANALTGATNLETVDASKAQIKTFKAKSFAKNKKLKVLKVNGNKIKSVKKNCFAKKSNNKKTKVYIYAANKTRFNKVVKMFKAAGLKKATYKFKKAK